MAQRRRNCHPSSFQASILDTFQKRSVDSYRLAEGQLADIIAVPGDPLADITVTRNVNFVMKGGKVFKNDTDSN